MKNKKVKKTNCLHSVTSNVKNKQVILILYTHYLPGYKAGGPIQSIAGTIEHLKHDYNFKIVCSDRDIGDKHPFPGEPVGHWHEYCMTWLLRIPPGLTGAIMIVRALRREKYDVLYINGVWPRMFSMLPLVCRRVGLLTQKPVILAPRGEFSSGSLSLKSGRKKIYIKLTAWLGLYRGIIWHASTHLEEADIRRLIGNYIQTGIVNSPSNDLAFQNCRHLGVIAVAMDIHSVSEYRGPMRLQKCTGYLRIVFLSRISPEKNLLFALSALHTVTGHVCMDIYGPIGDTAFWNKCQVAIEKLPRNVQVEYKGVIEHEGVTQVLTEHDLLFLPTLGENYSHVICEALCAGCPVLISDRTPWRNLEEKGVGWDIPLEEPERFQRILQQCVNYDSALFAALAARASDYGKQAASDPAVIDESRRMFKYAASISVEQG